MVETPTGSAVATGGIGVTVVGVNIVWRSKRSSSFMARPSQQSDNRLHPVPGYRLTVDHGRAAWAPDACTLPTADQPLRIAEFDDLFATAVRRRHAPRPAAWSCTSNPTPEVAATAAGLAARETACCSFFTFA